MTGHVAAHPSFEHSADSGLLMGEPDGPVVYVASLGGEVPTFIDPREDLIPPNQKRGTFKRLSYHVPFSMRGPYRAEWLPHEYGEHMVEAGQIRTDLNGNVMCSATSKRNDGGLCGNLAVNRANVCRNHGGALHPADKKMSAEAFMPPPEGRVEALSRVQQFMQGFLEVKDLSDEEVVNGYILDDDGKRYSSKKMSIKLQQQLTRELHSRMNDFMSMKLPTMLKRVADIAVSDVVEPEVSFKAAVWMAERMMGKTPEVLIHAQTGAPYEAIFESIESGSREDYRKSVASSRGQSEPLAITQRAPGVYSEDGEPLDVFEVDDYADDYAPQGFLPGSQSSDHGRTGESEQRASGETVREVTSDIVNSSFQAAEDLDAKKKRAQEIIDARKKAQRRRFAARAQGVTTITDMWWLPYFKPRKVMRNGVMVQEGWTCILVCPDDQNEKMLAKIAASTLP